MINKVLPWRVTVNLSLCFKVAPVVNKKLAFIDLVFLYFGTFIKCIQKTSRASNVYSRPCIHADRKNKPLVSCLVRKMRS